MSKKLISLALVSVMILVFAVAAIAANGPTVSYSYDSKTGDVVLTVKDGVTTLATTTVKFEKNATKTYAFDGYQVKVEYNGSGVKSATLVVTPPPSPAPEKDGLPNNGGSNGQDNIFGGITLSQYNNANFHCNADGNGRVWTTLGKNVTQKLSVPLHFVANTGQPVSNQANAATAWHLVHDNVYICEECGSAEWVTFSNNSGLPDGKNIQMNHPGQDFEIVKVWLDAEGNVIKDTKGLSATFKITWTGMDGKVRTKQVGPGKHFLPNDLNVKIEEVKVTAHYTLIEVKLNGEVVEDYIPQGVIGGDKATYTNKEDPYAIILKEWTDGNPGNITALFDIYKEDGETLVKGNVKANEKIYIDPGTYIVREQLKQGYIAQKEQEITVDEYKIGTCTFVNVPNRGSLGFTKKVEGTNIIEWLEEKGLDKDIVNGLKFTLALVGDCACGLNDHEYTEYPNSDGEILYSDVCPGTYILSEEIEGAAAGVFKQMADIEITLANGYNNFFVLGGTVTGNIEGIDIKADDEFSITYNLGAGFNAGKVLNYPGLNAGGEFFYIGVVNNRTNVELPSYCANGGSTSFGSGYLVAESLRVSDVDWIGAFNYIVDNYGGKDALTNTQTIESLPNSSRIVTQTVVWVLLGAVDVTSEAFATANLTGDERAAVIEILENYKGYVGKGTVVDILYMAVPNADVVYNQPQIVPVFGTFYVENEPEDDTGSLEVTVDAEKWYDLETQYDVYAEDWFNVYARDWFNVYAEDWFNVYAKDWFNVYAEDWFNVCAEDWYNVYAEDWYNVYAEDWYNVYAEDWYNVYAKDWFNVYAKDWYNVYAKDWYNVYAEDWYNVYAEDWFNVYAEDWFNVYAEDWFNVYAKDWFNVYTEDWFNVCAEDWFNVYVQDFFDRYIPEFKKETISFNGSGTLVSWLGSDDIVYRGTYNNGMTHLGIDVAAAQAGWLKIGIADSSKDNRPTGAFYYVTITDGQLVISVPGLTKNNCFGAVISSSPITDRPTSTLNHNNQTHYNLPAGLGATLYLYVHFDGATIVDQPVSDEYEFIKWEYYDTIKLDPRFVEKITNDPRFVEKITNDPEFVEKIMNDPKFVEKIKNDPRFVEKITNDPRFIEKITKDPRFVEKITKDPRFVEKITKDQRFVEKVTKDPRFIEKVTNDPRFVEKITKDPRFVEKVTKDPRFVEKITKDQKFVEKITKDPRFVEKVTNDPRFVEKIMNDPRFVEKITKDPRFVEKITNAPRFVEKITNAPRFVETIKNTELMQDENWVVKFDLNITGPGGYTYVDTLTNEGWTASGLTPGDYTITISIDGTEYGKETVTVPADGRATVNFEDITVIGETVKQKLADVVNEGSQLADVVNEGNQLADVVNVGVQLDDVVNEGVQLADVVNVGNQLADVVNVGDQLADVVNVGDQLADVVNEGVQLADVVNVGVQLTDVVNEGVQLTDVVNEGDQLADVVNVGDQLADVVNVGDQLADVVNVGSQLADVVNVGNQLADVVNEGNQLADVVNEGKQLDDVVNEGKQLDDVINEGIQLADEIKPGTQLPNIYLGSEDPEDPESILYGKYTPVRK